MMIQGNMLIAVLIVVSLAIAAFVVLVRLAVKKEPVNVETLLTGLLPREGWKGRTAAQKASAPGGAVFTDYRSSTDFGPAASDRSLMPPLSSTARAAPKDKGSHEVQRQPGHNWVVEALMGTRENKRQVQDEVRAMDEKLNHALRATEIVSGQGLSAGHRPATGLKPASDPRLATDLGPSTGHGPSTSNGPSTGHISGVIASSDPGKRDMEASPSPVSPGPTLKIEPEAKPGVPEPPTAMPPTAPPPGDAKAAPPGPEPARVLKTSSATAPPAGPADLLLKKKDANDDLFNGLIAEARKDSDVDLTIMGEYRDVAIDCGDLESGLADIMAQVSGHRLRKNARP